MNPKLIFFLVLIVLLGVVVTVYLVINKKTATQPVLLQPSTLQTSKSENIVGTIVGLFS